MTFTKGEWTVKQLPISKEVYVACGTELIAGGLTEANAQLIAKSPRMAEWIAKISKQNFVTFPEDRAVAKEILQTLDLS